MISKKHLIGWIKSIIDNIDIIKLRRTIDTTGSHKGN